MSKQKKRKNKKYNPTVSMASVKEDWLRHLWISDSSVHKEVVIHNDLHIPSRVIQPPEALLQRWTDELRSSKYYWRFIFFGFNIEKEEVYPSVMSAPIRSTTVSLCQSISDELDVFLEDVFGQIDSWAWAAVPSQEIDIDFAEEFYVEYFKELGVTDRELIMTRKDRALAQQKSV